MNIMLAVCGILLVFASCQKQSDGNKQNLFKQMSKATRVFSLTDSLTKYQNAGSLFEEGTHRYYVGTANETAFALVGITDSTTALYQKKGKDWVSTDTVDFLVSNVSMSDLNGDDFKDIIIELLLLVKQNIMDLSIIY